MCSEMFMTVICLTSQHYYVGHCDSDHAMPVLQAAHTGLIWMGQNLYNDALIL